MTLPNFVIIGAAKGGTTSLYWYLAEHPEVFMSPVKETNFFAWNLDAGGKLLYGDPDVHRFPVKSMEAYEALFAEAGKAKAVGEASPLYLEAPQAAARIRTVLPEARIVCTLRHPVDRAYSDYLMYIRRRGRPLDPARELSPEAPWAQPDSRWMQVSRYHAQLARYYEVFPRERIHVLLFDDIRSNAREAIQGVYHFLGVSPGFAPDTGTPHAAGGVPTSQFLERLLTRSALSTTLRRWVPVGAAKWVRRLRAQTLKKAPPLPAALRQELAGHFRTDITNTSKLIGRSLEHWL